MFDDNDHCAETIPSETSEMDSAYYKELHHSVSTMVNSATIWGRDADLTCFWRLDHTNGVYIPVNITAYPNGIHFQPLSYPARYGMIVLQQHHRLDLYDHLKQRRTEIHIQTNFPWVLNHFTNEEFCMAILFSPSLISLGESQVHDNVRLEEDSVPRDEQLAPGQLEERQSDARRKDKGKGKGSVKCGAQSHCQGVHW